MRPLQSLSGLTELLNRETLLLAASGSFLIIGLLGGWLGAPPAVASLCYLAAVLAGAVQIVPAGLRGVARERSLDINFLVTVAVAGALVLGEWSEAATVVFLFSFGEALEEHTLARTRRAIQALMAMAPDVAQLRDLTGRERTVAVEDVPVGSIVLVRPGGRIPLDGEVVAGESTVDQAPITGESVPVDKAPGATVYAGTINGNGYLEVRTTKPFAEGALAKIIHLVESAQSEKAPSQRFVESFARVYTPAVVVGAVLLVAIPTLVFGAPLLPWFNRALVLLLVACPCALVLSTPVSVVAAIGNASRHGVLIKGGAYLERAGRLRAVAFDKTGTLTRGVPEVQRVIPLNGVAAPEVLRLAAAAESRSEHPLAAAIVRAARRQGVLRDDQAPAVASFRAAPGSGIEATVDGAPLAIGKPSWLASRGFPVTQAERVLAELATAGQTPVLVAQDGTAGASKALVGVVAIADDVRPAAAETVQALRRSGVQRLVLLTGDNAATGQAIAASVGISPEDVHADLLPEDKVRVVRELASHHGGVAMVGDGVNDAPALAAATVGIAMGAAGSDAALETADVALVADDLTRLPWVLALSRKAARTIQVNVAFALTTKAIVLALAALGLANLWLAIAADTGASIVVILNGMRLLGRVPPAVHADLQTLRHRFGLEDDDHHNHGL